MRQLANQVLQVAIVYATQIRGWIWVLAAILFAFMFLALMTADGRSSMIIPFAFFYAQFFGTWIVDQVKYQFAHSRARLTPEFNAAHLIVPIAFIFVGCVVLPAILGTIRQIDPLPYAAVASISIAVVLLGRLFPRFGWIVAIVLIVAIWSQRDSDRRIDISSIQFGPALSIPLFLLGWLGIGFYFFKLCHLAEDDAPYKRLDDETRKVSADGTEGQTRAKFMQYARWCVLSDRWHAKIGGFHQFRTIRIIRLLRYGFGSTPAELAALGYAILMTLAVIFITPKTDDSYDITRSTDFVFLLVPALFASLAPIAVAGGAIGWRVPRLKNEIMFPLTRRQLIDYLLLASAWQSLLIWVLGCASGMGILLYVLPAESKTISLFATAALLTGATAIAAYGLSLNIVLWDVRAAQFFTLGLFALGFIALMLTWWTSREETGDTAYWVIAVIVSGVGALMTSSAHTTWLNLELG